MKKADEIHLTIELTPHDLQEAVRLHVKFQKKWIFDGFMISGWLLILLGTIQAFLGDFSYHPFIIGIILISFKFAWPNVLTNNIEKSQKNLFMKYDVVITENEISSQNESFSSSVKLNSYIKVIIGKQIILLYINEYLFHIYPKYAFERSDLKKFQSWLEAAVKTEVE